MFCFFVKKTIETYCHCDFLDRVLSAVIGQEYGFAHDDDAFVCLVPCAGDDACYPYHLCLLILIYLVAVVQLATAIENEIRMLNGNAIFDAGEMYHALFFAFLNPYSCTESHRNSGKIQKLIFINTQYLLESAL